MRATSKRADAVFGARLCAPGTSRSAFVYFMTARNFHLLRLELLAQDTAALHWQGPLPSPHFSTCISYA